MGRRGMVGSISTFWSSECGPGEDVVSAIAGSFDHVAILKQQRLWYGSLIAIRLFILHIDVVVLFQLHPTLLGK